MTNRISGPLNGIRVLDLTHVWAGPLGVRILADLGAEVVKVERAIGRGPRAVAAQQIGGWIGGEPGDEPWNAHAVFVKLARNRRSVCLDLKSAEGRNVFLQLVGVTDVVIENFSARAMPAMGLDYVALKTANPNIIYVTAPGYGTYGPYCDWVAFGPSVEPMTGLTTVMGYSEDEPRSTAMALIDPIAATSAAAAVVTAVRRRREEGRGAYVEMSLHESGVSFHGPWLIEQQRGGPIKTLGNRHPQMAPHGIYRCAGDDDWIAIGCPDDATWQSLGDLIGFDPSLDLAARRLVEDDIDAGIENWTRSREKYAAAGELQDHNVPAGPVNTTPDMTDDPQTIEREFFVPYERFETPMPGNPIKMEGLSASDWTPCPSLGEHNREVLQEWLDYSDAEVDELVAAGLLADEPPA
jgi:crotonobetainyl-CoA:carnitine CoA-transferase CaiB-like acyl-CoA transferase